MMADEMVAYLAVEKEEMRVGVKEFLMEQR